MDFIISTINLIFTAIAGIIVILLLLRALKGRRDRRPRRLLTLVIEEHDVDRSNTARATSDVR